MFLTFGVCMYWLPTLEKATLHVGQSRSSSAEQGKENKKRKSVSTLPPLRCSDYGGNKNKNNVAQQIIIIIRQ